MRRDTNLVILLRTALNAIITRSEPTVFENYVHDLYVDEQLVELSLWDTAGVCGPCWLGCLVDASGLLRTRRI